MRLEYINRVKENEVVGKSILTQAGQILLRAGIKLNLGYIKKLKQLGVLYIYIEDDRLEDIFVDDERLTELKQITMKSMSGIVKNVYNCDSRKLSKSLENVDNMIEHIIEFGDVNTSLYDIKTYDNYTYLHSLDTCIMSAFLGLSSGFNEWELKELGVGAILHDIGKTKLPPKIINKQGRLTKEEYDEVKRHTLYGAEMLKKNFTISNTVIKIVEQHHERVDGNGYPYGLKGDEISKFAKVVCVCDVYDAVSNNRCYRDKFSPNDAYELILAGSGTSFDKQMVINFKNTFAIYPLGCCIKLSNGEEGYVIAQNHGFPDRPVIRVLYDSKTSNPVPFYEIDLLKNINIVIDSIAS